jgi:hypothetical protein
VTKVSICLIIGLGGELVSWDPRVVLGDLVAHR